MQEAYRNIVQENTLDWFENGVLYHIYPLGMLGCERRNDGGIVRHRLPELMGLVAHLRGLGVNAVYFGPLFESSTHGYDTKDYFHIDRRLGDDEDFKVLVRAYHEAGIRVIVDGVFNHVGRDFWAFKDVQEKKRDSIYKDWFYINENGHIVLTEKAPPEAIESFKQFHEAYEEGREDDWFY